MERVHALDVPAHVKYIAELLDTLHRASEVISWSLWKLSDGNYDRAFDHVNCTLGEVQEVYGRISKAYEEWMPPVGDAFGDLPVSTEILRGAAPELLAALQAVSLTVAIHAGQNPGDREAQLDLAKVRAALRKATTVRETAPKTAPTNDPAHGGPGGGMGDAAAALPVCGCTIGNELHSRPLTRGEAAVGKTLDVTA